MPKQPSLAEIQIPDLMVSTTELPSIDQLLGQSPSGLDLPGIKLDLNWLDSGSLPALDPATLESWSFGSPPQFFPDPSPTEPETSWIEFTEWMEPHMWWPAPTYLMPAPMLGFPILEEVQADENESPSDALPTVVPEDVLGSASPEIIGAGSVIDRAYDWAFFDTGDVTVDGEVLSPLNGGLTRWLPGDTTFVGLFNDGLLIGPHLIPYPQEYMKWMQEHNIVVWK